MAKEKHTVCPNCGKNYYIYLSRCPDCHSPNNERPNTRMTFLPIPHQVSLFAIGLVGFNLLAALITIFVSTSIKDQPALSVLLINSISYSIIILADIILIWKYLPELFSSFKKGRTYLAGLVGFAVVLGGSMIINLIMSNLIPSAGTGENQSVAEMMVLANPFVSVLILGLIGPIVEEFTYRVGLFTLCKRAHTALAYIISIAVFTVIHLNFTSSTLINELAVLPDYLFAGAMFALIYHFEGFGASLLAHAGNNIFSMILILIKAGMK